MTFFDWLKANLATVIILAILVFVVALIVINLIKNKKQGKTSCGCGCTSCPMSGSCHKQKNK